MTTDEKVIAERILPLDAVLTVLPPDMEGLDERNRKLFEKALADVEEAESVQSARETFESVADRDAKLRAAQLKMYQRGKELVEAVGTANRVLEAGLIEQFANSGTPVDSSGLFRDLLVAEAESGALTRIIKILVQREIPLANIAKLRSESDLCKARAQQFDRIADERQAKTAELLREAAEYEAGLAIDTRTTLSGCIRAYARMLENQATELHFEAERAEQQYRVIQLEKQLESNS